MFFVIARMLAFALLLDAFITLPAGAEEQIGEFLKGKKIVYTIACQNAGRGTSTWELNNKGNLLTKDASGEAIEIVDGKALTEYFSYSAILDNGELKLVSIAKKLERVRFTDTLRIEQNTCKMEHKVECGKYCESIDPSCKVVRCTVQPVP
jgi:hypothetical protein